MPKLTVKDLLELKGVRQIAFVQVAREEEALAAAAAGMDMIGTGFRAQTRHFPELVPEVHFQFGLAWGRHASVGSDQTCFTISDMHLPERVKF